MTITSMISRPYPWVAAIAAVVAVVGCLPEFDEPPLSATGEALEVESSSSSGSTTAAATSCDGVYSGGLPAGAKFAGQTPCTINGNVDMGSLSPTERQQITGVKNIQGTLSISAAEHIAQLPALTSVYALSVKSFNSPTLDLPSRIAVQHTITISDGQVTAIKGFGGVKTLAAALTIQSLGNLASIDAFHALTSLKTLTVDQLSELKTFKAFTVLASATSLQFTNCQSLVALPVFAKLTTTANLQVSTMGSLTTLASFPVLTNANSLNISGMDKVPTVAFPMLKSVTNFNVSEMAKLAELEGFGAQLQISSSVQVCNILMKGADREVWKSKHAPGLNFNNCGNGCFGWGTC